HLREIHPVSGPAAVSLNRPRAADPHGAGGALRRLAARRVAPRPLARVCTDPLQPDRPRGSEAGAALSGRASAAGRSGVRLLPRPPCREVLRVVREVTGT